MHKTLRYATDTSSHQLHHLNPPTIAPLIRKPPSLVTTYYYFSKPISAERKGAVLIAPLLRPEKKVDKCLNCPQRKSQRKRKRNGRYCGKEKRYNGSTSGKQRKGCETRRTDNHKQRDKGRP